MLFKLSNLNSNFALTLGYLNPALNTSALVFFSLEFVNSLLQVETKTVKNASSLV